MAKNTYGLESLGITNTGEVFRNLAVPRLVEEALARGEGVLADNGSLCVETGKYTGRSPNDRFVVDEPSIHDEIAWGKVNVPISVDKFEKIYNRMMAYLQNRDLFIFDGFAGADPTYRIGIRVVNEYASQNMFMHQLLIRPTETELESHKADFTVICAPGFKCIPELDGVRSEAAILVSFERKVVVVAGSKYSGEMKKSVFAVMNYLLPKQNVFPMHCSANQGADGDVALFFGLSGTGKTTLSADPERFLIGDDEHGWSDDGVFNFEGGCYAKTIKLSKENEPQIWDAIKFGTLVENVVLNEDRQPDYDDDSLTENTRAGYPLEYIPNAVIPSVGSIPKNVVFLTADAYGVLPPIAKLTKEQAMYHFLSGYTSKLAGTERGITEPQATFSTAFGDPFLPLDPMVYANLLGEKTDKFEADVWLINTGWSGGPYGVGKRMSIKYTRAMVSAALNGQLKDVEFKLHPIFNVLIPMSCPNVPSEVLDPVNTWGDKAAYEKQAKALATKFVENFRKFGEADASLVNAGPKAE